MTFSEFKESLRGRTLFSTREFELPSAYFSNWCKQGKIVRLCRGIYRVTSGGDYDPAILANLLCPESYITSWTALERYGLAEECQPWIIFSSRPGRTGVFRIEGREYRFAQINRKIELPVMTLEGYRLASPPTAFLDLVNRNFRSFNLPKGIKYVGFDASQIRRLQFSTWIKTIRTPLSQLHMRVTGEQRRLKVRMLVSQNGSWPWKSSP